jgi:hypothetical protein
MYLGPKLGPNAKVRWCSWRMLEEQKQRYFSQSDVRVLSAYIASASLVELHALSFSKECQSLWLYMPINNHHASIPAQGIAGYEPRDFESPFMKHLRSNRARTSLHHLHQDHIQASAAEHKLLTDSLTRSRSRPCALQSIAKRRPCQGSPVRTRLSATDN